MRAIVAVDKEWGIGKNNGMLFHLPKDLAFFKKTTMGKVIVMGGNTLLSFPNSKPLPGRTNIVLSESIEREDCVVVKSLSALFSELEKYSSDDIFIVGGAKFYATMIDYCAVAYVTKVDEIGEATVFFPNLDDRENWSLRSESDKEEDNGHIISFTEYVNAHPKKFIL